MPSSPGRSLVPVTILGLVVLVAACSTGAPSPAPPARHHLGRRGRASIASVARSIDGRRPARPAGDRWGIRRRRRPEAVPAMLGRGVSHDHPRGWAPGLRPRRLREVRRCFTSRLASERRTCAYDRAGYGRSDPAPDERPRQLEDVHADLQALLEAAGIEGPYVLVGSSFGGFIATTYASRFPDDVQGWSPSTFRHPLRR